jgi:predicted nucleotidyltransferase
MDAAPMLRDALAAINRHLLDAVMIGNAAAALHGAPVTTLDVDFMFRATPLNLRKLKAVAKELEAVIMRPYYPVSKLFRMTNDDRGLQLDFMPVIHGIRSFESLKSRATEVTIQGQRVWLAGLEDIIRSKKAAGRLRDTAVLPILEKTLYEFNASEEHKRNAPAKEHDES